MTTDDRKRDLIEQATWDLIEWDTDTSDRGVSDEHYRERRADVERVWAVFESAQTPTDDEREALYEAGRCEADRLWPLNCSYTDRQLRAVFSVKELDAYRASAFKRGVQFAAGFRHPVPPEASGEVEARYVCPAHPFGCPEPSSESTKRVDFGSPKPHCSCLSSFDGEGDGQCAVHRPEPQTEPKVKHWFDTDDCVTGDCDCEFREQSEPTDAQVLAALNARELSVRERSGSARHFTPAPDLSYYSEGNIADTRAALRAAAEEGKNRP